MTDIKLIRLEQWINTMIDNSNLDIKTLKVVLNKVKNYRKENK